MKSNKKYITIFLYVFLVLTFSSVICYADTINNSKMPDDVNNAVVKFSDSIKGALKSDMVHFGLSASDDIDGKLTFGKGYRYYEVSKDALKDYNKTQKKKALKTFFKDSNTYIIPLKVGDKSAGVVYFQYIDGKWQFFKLSSDLSFESDLESTISYIQTNPELDKGLKKDSVIIDDYSTDLTAIGLTGTKDEYVIPIRISGHMNASKNSILTVADIEKEINTLYNKLSNGSSSSTGGGGFGGSTLNGTSANSKQKKISTIIIISSIVSVVSLASIFIYKKRN